MSEGAEPKWFQDLKIKIKPKWLKYLINPNGITPLIKELPKSLPAANVGELGHSDRWIWEHIGLFYRSQQRWYDAIALYSAMYDHFLNYQLESGNRIHKGMPLIWIADCYFYLGFNTLSKRYLMLTLCEDAITHKGKLYPLRTGVYYRLAWRYGMTDSELKEYASKVFEVWVSDPNDSSFPEWIIQEIDKSWNIEIPNSKETSYYMANKIYINYLRSKLGERSGKQLEKLAEYLLSCMSGCRTARRKRSYSTDYDIVCSVDGPEVDFRSEFGRYFVCECKDWKKPVGYESFAKFCRVLDSVKSRFGILFSKKGITGTEHSTDASREQLKVYQDRGMVIVVINEKDIKYVSNGGNFIGLLKDKYENVRLDLR